MACDPGPVGRIVRETEAMFERDQGRAQIFQMGIEHAGLVLERGISRGEEQHVLDDGEAGCDLVGLEQAGFSIVLEPDQDVTIAGDGVVGRAVFGLCAMGGFEQIPQSGDCDFNPVIERVEDHTVRAVFEPDQEMSGEI